ncbi:IPTL-CTERM sorting domain-containing protein [Diaphorobacter aerolatus]|uniref:IPTL-CTERM sorting domain-containing protein n=1 Tax=Diaphorobacter aerolatus TaxID=1288495 RepID=A0A7H0GHL0_9BURK|nr:IPTL-CTERM sorting domain-containing protein [Diaphorobacter aerolatus]QNP47776.1 IPTL-CTERM sorting domain-containing protein [Diaphorobacter aerolatus]
MFKLIKPDASELPMNTTALNPCRQGTRYAFDATKTNEPGYLPKNTFNGSPVFAAQLRGDRAYLITDAAVGMRFTNLNSRGSGNDGAFDNIVMLDVSPNLAKSFSPAAISVGQTSRLTFTVTNTTDLLEKAGWTFKDTLPVGMVVASPANISNQCGATTVAASSGAAVIDVTSGVLAAGASECTISVDVTAQAASPLPASGAILQNAFGSQAGPGIVTTTALVPTTGASLTVTPVADMVATPTAPIQWGLGVPGSITTVCANNGPDIAAAATCEVSGAPAGAQTICTPASGSTDLQPNQSIACVTSFTMTTPGTVTLTTKAGSTSTDPNPGNNVQTVNVTAVPPAADMQAAAPTSVSAVTGQSTTVTTTCTNNGPDSAAMATCTVTGAPSGATTICTPASPMASLAVGASMSCATTFTPTTAGSVTLTTTAGTSTVDSNSANNVASTTVTAGAAPIDAAAVPTLGEWALIALSTLLGGFAWVSLRRRRVP